MEISNTVKQEQNHMTKPMTAFEYEAAIARVRTARNFHRKLRFQMGDKFPEMDRLYLDGLSETLTQVEANYKAFKTVFPQKRSCQVCGAPFVARNHDVIFCGHECNGLYETRVANYTR